MIFLKRHIIWMGLIACLGFASCSPRALHEAQEVVAQADSLRAEGQLYADSARLAQACKSLEHWQLLYPTDYTHACYHYGRLLREQDNPVEAMQAFINATHTRTRDNHILGRVYSNMGDMCHLAGEFALSYDMFEKSADCFLQNADTLLYYYGLNNMAFELAEQGEKEEAIAIVNAIDNSDEEILALTWETKAKIYKESEQYDSAIYWINQMVYYGLETPSGILTKAQSFSRQDIADSAIICARQVLTNPYSSYQNRFNAIYIILHNDSTLDKNEINALASQREDIRYYEYEPEKEQLIYAVQLLNDDINAIPNYLLFVIIGVVVLFSYCGLGWILHRLKQKQTVLRIENEEHSQLRQATEKEIESRCKALRKSTAIKEVLQWKQYDEMCRVVDSQFFMFTSKLQEKGNLNERDIRLCILVLIDLSHAEIAKLMYVEEGSVGKLKERTSKKLYSSRKNMRKLLLNIVLGVQKSKLSSL